MTKTLTEQWREGTLGDGFYYILIDFFGKKEIRTEELFSGEFCTTPQEFVKEILDVVPPYVKLREIVRNSKESSKVKKLQEQLSRKTLQLSIATKALKEYERCENGSYAHKALALIKEVK